MPSEWLKEMGCGAESEPGTARNTDAGDVDKGAPDPSATLRAQRAQKEKTKTQIVQEDGGNGIWKHVISVSLAVLITGIVYYYYRARHPTKTVRKNLIATTQVEASILAVYDYVSTPDFRTEWHLGSVGINGPAIDHSSVPGEVFAEDMLVNDRDVSIEWNVLEREIPSAATSQHAEFALEGIAKIEGRPSETWKEIIRLRTGMHQYAKTAHVKVEVELDIGPRKPDESSKRWRKQLLRSLKESAALLRDRIRERMQGQPR